MAEVVEQTCSIPMKTMPNQGRKRIAWLCGGALVLSPGGWFFYHRHDHDLVFHARRAVGCIENQDAACLEGYLLPNEKELQHLDSKKLNQLLSSYVAPAYKAFSESRPSVSTDLSEQYASASCGMQWMREPNAPAQIGLSVAETLDGIKAPHLMRNLICNTMRAKYAHSASEHDLIVLIRGLKQDGPLLTRLGFPSMYDPEVDRVATWDDIRTRYIEKARKHHVGDDQKFD